MKHAIKEELILIEALQQGSQKSFDRLYANYTDFVYRSINSIIHSPDDAQEISNDIFMKIWHNRDKIDRTQTMKKYLLVAAQRASYNFLKSKPIREINDTIRVDDYMKETAGLNELMDPNHNENSFYANELAMSIRLVVDRMPEQRRIVFEQSRYQGLSNNEIAEKMNLSTKTIESHITLALKELKRFTLAFYIIYCFTHFLRVGADRKSFSHQPAIGIECFSTVMTEVRII